MTALCEAERDRPSVRHRVEEDVDADRVAFDRESVEKFRIIGFALVRVAQVGVVRCQHEDVAVRVVSAYACGVLLSSPASDVWPPVPRKNPMFGICGMRFASNSVRKIA